MRDREDDRSATDRWSAGQGIWKFLKSSLGGCGLRIRSACLPVRNSVRSCTYILLSSFIQDRPTFSSVTYHTMTLPCLCIVGSSFKKRPQKKTHSHTYKITKRRGTLGPPFHRPLCWPCLPRQRILFVFRFFIEYSSLRDFGP